MIDIGFVEFEVGDAIANKMIAYRKSVVLK